ncbi:MAG: class III extradiol dioxygenase subunit B-like domain-containing protein [Acidobacteriota bacterium]
MPAPTFSALLPHPPIIVPEVGRERLDDCRATFDACRDVARRMMAARPDRLVLVSPHAPRRNGAFGLWSGTRLRGDLGRFGAPSCAVDLASDAELSDALAETATANGLTTRAIAEQPLDHGAVVPLWFLVEAGWRGPTTIVALPQWPTSPAMIAFGRAVAAATMAPTTRLALIASGDMSHRVLPEAPAGYHPRAVEFDQALTDLLAAGQLDRIAGIDPELRQLAAEDAADTTLIAAAAVDYAASGTRVVSYEHPFGVGYLVAVVHDATA